MKVLCGSYPLEIFLGPQACVIPLLLLIEGGPEGVVILTAVNEGLMFSTSPGSSLSSSGWTALKQ